MADNIDLSIDYEVVQEVAKMFSQGGDNFNMMIAPLTDAGSLLANQFSIGKAGKSELGVLDLLQQEANRLALRCQEMVTDLNNAISDYQAADNASMT